MLKHGRGQEAYKNWMRLAPIAVLLTTIGTGCGNYSYQKKKGGSGSSSDSVLDLSDYLNTGPQAAGATTGGTAPYRVKIRSAGYDGSVTVKIPVRKTLRVAFLPGKQESTTSDGTFYPYSMLSVYIGVGNNAQPTELLANGYGGGTARQSSTIDLSDAFDSSCDSGDTGCKQEVSVTISRAQSDDVCFSGGSTVCANYYGHVPAGHPWNGTLIIQNDDTTAL